MMIGYLHFANPTWLWAITAALGVPLVVHLLGNRGGRQVVIPSIRLIERSQTDLRRFLRWRHWLILTLRAALLGSLVVAFARPVWHSDGQTVQMGRRVVTLSNVLWIRLLVN